MKKTEDGRTVTKIAYITADWNRELVSIALEAAASYLKAHPDLRMQVFNCFGFALHTGDPKQRYKIYELPDFRNYDAIVIQAHQIVDSFALEDLAKRVKEAGIPAVSIGAELEGCLYVGTDDYNASRRITEHLIDRHGARSFVYIKGPERDGGGEACDRRRGFEDVCRERDIPEDAVLFFDGNWQSEDGSEAVRRYLESGRPLPDAFVSANDEMALGAIGALSDRGIRIPENVLVTGFDDIFSASLSEPRLTTISRDFPKIVRTAMDLLLQKLHGGKPKEHTFSPFGTVFSESCGCAEHTASELLTLRREFYDHSRRLGRFYSLRDRLTAGLYGAASPSDVFGVMEECGDIFGSPRMYIYLNDFYFDNFWENNNFAGNDPSSFADHFILAAVSGLDLTKKVRNSYMRISKSALSEAPLLEDEQFTIFYSLYFEGVMIGFMTLVQPPSVAEMNLHESIVNLLVFALENNRQKLLARQLNETLDALAVTDQLTGLYNRFGYERFGETLCREIRERGHEVRVLFVDIDNMKAINDRNGHAAGDLAIRHVARIIRESCRRSDFKMRYGGDEFVIVTDASDADIRGRIEERMADLNESGELPFYLGVSIGDCRSDGRHPFSLGELLERADERMYEDKVQKRG